MLNTFQGGYELLADSSVDATLYDGSSVGLRYIWADFSLPVSLIEPTRGTKSVGTECNAIEIISIVTGTADNEDGNMKLYGRTENGPAEYLADISMTVGLARAAADNSTSLYVDTMTIAEQVHLKNFTVKDSGNDRIAKLQFDFGGYKYLTAELYDVSDGSFEIYYRVY